MTGRQLLALLQQLTEEELDLPATYDFGVCEIEGIDVRTARAQRASADGTDRSEEPDHERDLRGCRTCVGSMRGGFP